MRIFAGAFLLSLLLAHAGAAEGEKADAVLVVKSEKRLYLLRDEQVLASYRVTFGGDPKGHKVSQGDQRTPEGAYVLDYKNAGSRYHRSIHVSYPNAADRKHAAGLGIDPGGDIMIHGQPNGWGWASLALQLFSWTDGCIALSDRDMDRVWEAVDPGTPIEIRP